MLRWTFEDSLPLLGAISKWLSQRKCRKNKYRNFCISTFNYQRYTQFISRYMFLGMTNTMILLKKSLYIKKDFKSMMAANFGHKIIISMKSINMSVSILPKTKSFTVLCVFIANYDVNIDKSKIHGLPGVFKDVDHGKKINHFRKRAFIYHRFILFNSK